MLIKKQKSITVSGNTIKWYKDKGYKIPTYNIQLYCNKNGVRVKNGKDVRVKKGTKITVQLKDLHPKSNEIVDLKCTQCDIEYKTTWSAYKRKKTTRCIICTKQDTKGDGCHSYWVEKLIGKNPNAKCDISGEKDKRFLILHHLLSRKQGGRNIDNNYVILSANYHTAFHNSLGGTQYGCNPKQYYLFKENELK